MLYIGGKLFLNEITDENRPPSRQGDIDRSRLRADYDKDAYYREKQRGSVLLFISLEPHTHGLICSCEYLYANMQIRLCVQIRMCRLSSSPPFSYFFGLFLLFSYFFSENSYFSYFFFLSKMPKESLAHLSHRLKVSYYHHPMSIV